MNIQEMREFAAEIRKEAILSMAYSKGGHIGGVMSIADVLAVLYGTIMKYDPQNPKDENRDRFVLSKGHCGPALYATLALRGFFDKELLKTINMNGTQVPSHCDMNKTSGVDMTTGSLGQGFSNATGIAEGLRIKGNKDSFVYVIVGDGELQEGQIWEAVQFSASRKQKNLIMFVDSNKKQLDGDITKICNPFDLPSKFKSFGFYTQEVDGHDVEAILNSIENAQKSSTASCIVLNTIKGAGCSFAQDALSNHYIVFGLKEAEEANAIIDSRVKNGLDIFGEEIKHG